MPRKKKVIPEYGTCIRKGIEYYRTRIVDSDGKRVSLYARTPEKLYEKVQEAERLIAEASFRISIDSISEGFTVDNPLICVLPPVEPKPVPLYTGKPSIT